MQKQMTRSERDVLSGRMVRNYQNACRPDPGTIIACHPPTVDITQHCDIINRLGEGLKLRPGHTGVLSLDLGNKHVSG
ncbi:hypothetical protein ElyMa_002674300 [Elysia marginata]|uniref:Uncharacterized protein n=1 Tax=Elysia marginata TaxID=1093978 RepID=A0AAV4HAG9_9GAST|nr:hypothetical protein ElyMa_002674300 [Elysia marginata]